MPLAQHVADERRSTALVLAALIAPLVVVAAMYLHTRRTEHRRQETVDGALKDYAAIAAWQLSKRVGDAVHQLAINRMGENRGMMGRCARCEAAHRAAPGAFSFDPATNTVSWGSEAANVDTTYSRAIADITVSEISRATEEPHRLRFATIAGRARTILLFVPPNPSIPVSGIDGDDDLIGNMIRVALERGDLLPRSLVRPPYRGDEIFVRLTRGDGSVVFENVKTSALRLAAADSTVVLGAPLTFTVELQPALAERLLLGAPTQSPTSLFLLLIVLSVFLAMAAIAQLRRTRELGRLRTRFVANVSHELRTPLAHISMFAETLMLSRERSDDERRHFASVIFRESRRLSTLVESVLRFARAEVRSAPLNIETSGLAGEVAEVVAAFEPIAHAASATICIDDVDDMAVAIDRGAFRQILLNLLDNAVKYGPDGQTVVVRAYAQSNHAAIAIEDCGPGIPAEERERAFEPFVRLTGGPKRSGTGIGLSVVRELAVAQNGHVWIEDRAGGGARVCLRLPLAANASAATPAPADAFALPGARL